MEAAPIDTSLYKGALVVLGAAGVVIPLFHRLRVSPVIGFMLVGVVVGPFGLASLAPRWRWLPSSRSRSRRRSSRSPTWRRAAAVHDRSRAVVRAAVADAPAGVWPRGPAGRLCAAALAGTAMLAGYRRRSAHGHRPRACDVVHRRRDPGACRGEAAQHRDRPGQLRCPAVPGPGRGARAVRLGALGPGNRGGSPGRLRPCRRPGIACGRADRRPGPAGAAAAVPQRRAHPQRGTVRCGVSAGGDRAPDSPPRPPGYPWRSAP